MSLDLTGAWSGFYNYPFARPPVPFEASLEDRAGMLTGFICEEGDSGADAGLLTAHVDGRREGQAVRFVKRYEPAGPRYDTVMYEGETDAEGSEIAGSWRIPGAGSGTFLMVRQQRASEPERIEAEVGVPTR